MISQRVASAGDDQLVRIWSTVTGREERVLRGHTAEAWAVAFSPDGKLLASASVDTTVRLWDVATGEPVHVLTEKMGQQTGADTTRAAERLHRSGTGDPDG